MRETRLIMGMPVTVEVVDRKVRTSDIQDIFLYFDYIDRVFSTYKKESEISRININDWPESQWSDDVKTIFQLSDKTKRETNGYFDIFHNGKYDPSGIVKGWAIRNAGEKLRQKKFTNYYVEAGGDIQVSGRNAKGNLWRIGLQNPFNLKEIIKVVILEDRGIATSGVYIRGQHIYNPHETHSIISDIVSLTVIGPNVYDADRFATAAFAMNKKGISFIENLQGFEGYMIDEDGRATFTSGFNRYVLKQ